MGADDMPRTSIFSAKDVGDLLHMAEVMGAVEEAFRLWPQPQCWAASQPPPLPLDSTTSLANLATTS